MLRSLILLLLLPVAGFSQNFIGQSKPAVIKRLQAEIRKNDSLQIILTDTGSTVHYSVKAGKVQPADFIYGFDENGKCQSEKIKASCDSCFKKYLQKALDQKKYKWKKINENQYVSRYAKKMMIELPGEGNDFSFIILRTTWTKKLYALLMN